MCSNTCQKFWRRKSYFQFQNDWHTIGLTNENHIPVLSLLEHHGLIEVLVRTFDEEFGAFKISPLAVQVARDMDKQEKKSQEPKDLVDEFRNMARKTKAIAISILAVSVFVVVITGVNQLLSLV